MVLGLGTLTTMGGDAMNGRMLVSGGVLIALTTGVAAQDIEFSPELIESLGPAVAGFAEANGAANAFEPVSDVLAAAADPGAQMVLALAGAQVDGEAAAERLGDVLADLSKRGAETDLEANAAAIAEVIVEIGAGDGGAESLTPGAAARLSEAIEAYDALAEEIGAPSFRELVLEQLPEELSGPIGGVLDTIDQVAELAETLDDVAAGDAEAADEFVEGYLDLFPNPATAGPGGVALRDLLVWDTRMYSTAADGLDLVTRAIETGEVDTAELQRITDTLNSLARGPWNEDTIRDMMRGICSDVPVLSDLCEYLAGDELYDPALVVWEGVWSTGWGDLTVTQHGGGIRIVSEPDDFLDRRDGEMHVTAARPGELGGNYAFPDYGLEGTFVFTLNPDQFSFAGHTTGGNARTLDGVRIR